MIRQKGLLVLHSEDARIFAVDLESRLSESALAMVQIADIRQFAHGRHLQLADPKLAPYVIFVSSEREQALINATTDVLPSWVSLFKIEILGETPSEIAIRGLIDAMFLTEATSAASNYDPGQPAVPQFGRDVHGIDPRKYLRRPELTVADLAAKRKAQPTPGEATPNIALKAAEIFLERLTTAKIHAIVCDFDGTLCRAEDRFGKISTTVVSKVEELIQQGMGFAIAQVAETHCIKRCWSLLLLNITAQFWLVITADRTLPGWTKHFSGLQ
jgi:hypothetical protein